MTALDAGKSYTISSTAVIYQIIPNWEEVEKTYAFKPVDLSDGLHYYALRRPRHTPPSPPADIGKRSLISFDATSRRTWSGRESQLINETLTRLVKGEKPVVFARGNHEVKWNALTSFTAMSAVKTKILLHLN